MTSAFKYSARFFGDIPKVKPNLATPVLMLNVRLVIAYNIGKSI